MNNQERYYIAVLDYLKASLTSGSMTVGSAIPPAGELAAKLGYAETSVSDVLDALETIGILSLEQGTYHLTGDMGSCFMDVFSLMLLMGRFSYSDISHLRRGIELQVLADVLQNISESEKNDLNTCLLRMKASVNGDAKADKRFHDILIGASGNTLVICILRAMSQVLDLQFSALAANYPANAWHALTQAHEQLYFSICRGDLPAAKNALSLHYDLVDEEISHTQA
jgi:DNA-binding FadR family transcriptional regulator